VSSHCRIVKQGKHPPLKIIVSHNDEGITLPPEVAWAMFDIELSMPAFGNWPIFGNALQVDDVSFDISIQVIILNTVDLDEVAVSP
jgi:hypothetical protein